MDPINIGIRDARNHQANRAHRWALWDFTPVVVAACLAGSPVLAMSRLKKLATLVRLLLEEEDVLVVENRTCLWETKRYRLAMEFGRVWILELVAKDRDKERLFCGRD